MHFCEDFPKVYPKRATCLNPEQDLLVRSLRCVLGKNIPPTAPLFTQVKYASVYVVMLVVALSHVHTYMASNRLGESLKMGGVLPEKLGGGVQPTFGVPKPLPYLWPKSVLFPGLFMTWPKIWHPIYDRWGWHSFPKQNFLGAFVDCPINSDEKVASSKKTYLFQDECKTIPIYEQNGWKTIPLGPYLAWTDLWSTLDQHFIDILIDIQSTPGQQSIEIHAY